MMCDASDWELHLTKGKCFRYEVDPNYKINRVSKKPTYYAEMVTYLVDSWGATVNEKIEADDAVAMHNDEPNTILAYIDKDLKQLPGRSLDYGKMEFRDIDEEQAQYNYWEQVIMGDKADDIIAINGVGPVKAAKVLKECWGGTDYQYYQTCLKAYLANDLTEERLNINCELLYLLRSKDDKWSIPCQS